MSALVVIARYISAPELMVAKSLLESAGIQSLAPEQHALSAIHYVIEGSGGYRLMVDEEFVEQALAILRDAQADAGED
jgi:Putative prokaryotic signal transducing protein